MKAAILLLMLLWVMSGPWCAAEADPPVATPSKRAAERAAQLKASAKMFRLDLSYHGDQDKPFYALTLSVPAVPQLALNPFHPVVQITEEEAVKVIDHLAEEGFLDQATDKVPGPVAGGRPGYMLKVRAGDVEYFENLGWGGPMLKRLDGIKAVLAGNAAKAMDLLLGRLAGHRREWAK